MMLVVTYRIGVTEDKFRYVTFFDNQEAITYAQCAAYDSIRTIALLKCLDIDTKGETNENN